MNRNLVLTVTDLENLLSDPNREVDEIIDDLNRLKGRRISLVLREWSFYDVRPIDDCFEIRSTLHGAGHRLNLYLHDGCKDLESRRLLFEIGPKDEHPPINVNGVVDGCGPYRDGLYIWLKRAEVVS